MPPTADALGGQVGHPAALGCARMAQRRVIAAAVTLLLFTLGVLGFTASLGTPNATPGAPVAGDRDSQPVNRIVLIGVPGWSWSQISDGTPTLADMVAGGASGSLVVRGTYPVTCPADGWLTLGAGQRAALDEGDDASRCAIDPATLVEPAKRRAVVADMTAWQTAAEERPIVPALGALSDALATDDMCVAAYGPLAALGAADSTGAVASYEAVTLATIEEARTTPGQTKCAVDLIDGSSLTPAELDAQVAVVAEGLEDDTLLIVAGLSDDARIPALHPVVMSGAAGGTNTPQALWSASTRQFGLIQTTDLTSTILANFGIPEPETVSGSVITSAERDGADPLETNRNLVAAATLAPRVLPGFAVVVGSVLALCLVGSAVWARFSVYPQGGALARLALAVSGSAVMALPGAAFAASLLPWWRGGADPGTTDPATVALMGPTLALVGATALIGAVIVGLAWGAYVLVPHSLVPVAVIASATMLVIGVDVLRGGRLGLISVMGVLPVAAGRFYGMGNVAFGIFSAATLILAGCIASMLTRPGHPFRWLAVGSVVSLGLTAAAIDGAPNWGADFGGVPATLVGTGLLATAAAGRKVKASLVLLFLVISVAAAAVAMVADWLRPPEDRTHLGNFVAAVLNGEAWQIVTRKLDQSVGILLAYPASWLAVAALGVGIYAVAAPRSALSRSLRPLWDQPLMHACATALIGVWLLGWVLNDSGISVVALGLIVSAGAAVAVAGRGRSRRPETV